MARSDRDARRSAVPPQRPLWACPECGRRFANRSQAHSCTDLTVRQHLADKSAAAVAVYREVEGAIGECGEFRLHPVKTRIAFIDQMSFAGVTLRQKWVDLGFISGHPIESERVRKLELFGPVSWRHTVRLRGPADVDDEVRGWLAGAYRRGRRQDLDASVVPPGPVGRTRMEAAFASRVIARADGPALRAPTYVADALADRPLVAVRLSGRGTAFDSEVAGDDAATWVPAPPTALAQAGLVTGDRIDVVVRPI